MYGTKFSEYKPKECRYCYFWCGKNKRCFLGKENCYYETVEEAVEKSVFLAYGTLVYNIRLRMPFRIFLGIQNTFLTLPFANERKKW